MEANSFSYSSASKYDVFLSFRGEDTRYNFVSHLYEALNNKGIFAFKDDKELERGKSIEPSLIEAIQNSKTALVVLSPNYASSPWCLDELVEIVRCKNTKDQIVLPIFYGVDPSDVEMQTGILTKAFKEHELNFKKDKVQIWRNALSIVATTSGWDAKCFYGSGAHQSEADLIKCIVRNISDRLVCDGMCFEDELVGIESHTMEIEKLLNFKCDDVRMVGIWGIGGIGKTTLADFIYHKHSDKFDACYRIKDIQRKNKQKGLIALQKEFISQILLEKCTDIWEIDFGCDVIRKRLRRKKVLVLLDDIDKLEQLKVLANKTHWFGRGSRIIITTRDEHLFTLHEVKYVYKVPLLKENQALQLFSVHAFGKNQPPNDFLELSKQFVSYAHGLPLILKVLGAHLHSRDIVFWYDELKKLKIIPNGKILRVFRVNFDRSDDDFVKTTCFDIAFFLSGWNEVLTKHVLHHCGLYSKSVFETLKEKALLTTERSRICMHEVIQAMGREIVREESKDSPNKYNRSCDPSVIYAVLTNSKLTF